MYRQLGMYRIVFQFGSQKWGEINLLNTNYMNILLVMEEHYSLKHYIVNKNTSLSVNKSAMSNK
jgi:hypothetical protein